MSATSVNYECQVRVSATNVSYQCRLRISATNVSYDHQLNEGQQRVSATSVSYECQLRVSSTNVSHECQLQASATNVSCECHLRMSATSVSCERLDRRHMRTLLDQCRTTQIIIVLSGKFLGKSAASKAQAQIREHHAMSANSQARLEVNRSKTFLHFLGSEYVTVTRPHVFAVAWRLSERSWDPHGTPQILPGRLLRKCSHAGDILRNAAGSCRPVSLLHAT